MTEESPSVNPTRFGKTVQASSGPCRSATTFRPSWAACYMKTGPLTHRYKPDFIVNLANDVMLLLEIKGFEVHEQEKTNAKHQVAQRWVTAVNNLKDFGKWEFLVCRDMEFLLANIGDLWASRLWRSA